MRVFTDRWTDDGWMRPKKLPRPLTWEVHRFLMINTSETTHRIQPAWTAINAFHSQGCVRGGPEIPNPSFKRLEIQNPIFKQAKIQNLNLKKSNPKFNFQNPKSRFQRPQNPKSKFQMVPKSQIRISNSLQQVLYSENVQRNQVRFLTLFLSTKPTKE